MESPGDYLESPMDGDDVAYPCKGCGDILEEGKAFELAGNRWHLNCFRCNTCGTLLDSDANLLLLGDGSLICNNCTYSCSACGNKIEDLAILTGDQAFCATCFRCRNCKRKIENLRYARTSQGIFCMSCHESLMARRRKKSRAAASAKKKEEQSPMLVDKSLPALPPSAAVPGTLPQASIDNPNDLSPRPRHTYSRNDEPSRGNSQKTRDRSPEGTSVDIGRDGLTLPTTTYRNNRHSGILQPSEMANGDGESFFIPLALDHSPAPTVTPRTEKENRPSERDYFGANGSGRSQNDARARPRDAGAMSPHIGYQEKGRQPSADETSQIRENIRKAQDGSARAPASIGNDDTKLQHASSPTNLSARNNQSTEKFRLGEVPKGKKSGTSRSNSASDITSSEFGGKATPRSSQDDSPPSLKSASRTDPGPARIQRKDLATTANKDAGSDGPYNTTSAMSISSSDTSPSIESSPEVPNIPPRVTGKTVPPPAPRSANDTMPPRRAANRPHQQQQLSDTYMSPRAAPIPLAVSSHINSAAVPANGGTGSPLPRWSAGGDFTMDEDMARILGTDESSQSILARVSNAARHGRASSETSSTARNAGHGRSASETTTRTAQSPRWPGTPIAEDPNGSAISPSSLISPASATDPALLRRQLRTSEQRVAELEKQFGSEKDLKNLNKKLQEKRKTVSVLDSQTEIMIRQLEVLAGYVERAKDSKNPMPISELEDSAIKDFVTRLERLKQNISGSIEQLYEERDVLLEEKQLVIASRDRALVEFEQLSSKNAQLADMNNDMTHQLQERFKAQSNVGTDSSRPTVTSGLGIYTHKDKSNLSIHRIEDASHRPSTSTTGSTVVGTVNSYPHPMEQDPSLEPATVLSAPQMVNIRKGQAKKFNWKKGGQTVAKGVTKGFKGAFSSGATETSKFGVESIGMPYNTTVAPVESVQSGMGGGLPRSASIDPSRQGGFGLFKKNGMPKSASSGNFTGVAAEAPSTLFGSDLVERADYERRQIPSIVTRCIEEVEIRGMDIEGIYRKTGGSGQVKAVQEGFENQDDFDISDQDLDITAVTSALKQYFRKLPMPLLTFDVYDRVLESGAIEDDQDRCTHLRRTFNTLPPKHRDCLEFLIFHLVRVAMKESQNLMTPKNLAVVFAPTIMRDESIEREMTDMHAKNSAVQFIIENSNEIFSGA